jgi:hypothetical protein
MWVKCFPTKLPELYEQESIYSESVRRLDFDGQFKLRSWDRSVMEISMKHGCGRTVAAGAEIVEQRLRCVN